MNDSALKKMYFHEHKSPCADKNVNKRAAPYQKRREKSASPVDIYGGSLTEVQFERWKLLCGLSLNDFPTSVLTVPTPAAVNVALQPPASNPSPGPPSPTLDMLPSTSPFTASELEMSQFPDPLIRIEEATQSTVTVPGTKTVFSPPLSENPFDEHFEQLYTLCSSEQLDFLQNGPSSLSFLDIHTISIQDMYRNHLVRSRLEADLTPPTMDFHTDIPLEPLMGQPWIK
jgi:hypothetical protein